MRLVYIGILALAFLTTLSIGAASAQVDEVSQATGLPIPIGAPVIFGQVIIRNIPKGQQRPTVFVYLRNSGIPIEKTQANDRGYYYFLRNPSNGMTLAFEIDGSELGTALINPGLSNRVSTNVEFDWNTLNGATAKRSPATISVDAYNRSADAQKDFDAAMALVKGNKNSEAIAGFEAIVHKDPKDHVAWLMLGTINYTEKHPTEARNAFAKALELHPEYFLAHLNLGRVELSEKNYDAAIANLLKAVAEDPKSADADHLLGEAYLQAKKGSLAVGYLNKAIELDPVGKAEIHLRLAALYNGAGYKDRAAREYVEFLKKVKDYPDKKKLEKYISENPPKQ